MLADTSFVVDVLRGYPPALDALDEVESGPGVLHVSSVTLFELFRGLAHTDTPAEERERVEDVVSSRPILPLQGTGARRGGREDGRLEAQGEPIDPEDAMIAGVALAHGMPAVTGNQDHFGRIEGLEVHGYE